jgi:Mn2+/Fe2+ NRAMP family transporter
VKKFLDIALGLVTSIGGFLEVGSVITAMQAGAEFQFQLLWVLALGTLCVVFLVEMAGRLPAVSRHTIVDATRERFGFAFFAIVMALMAIVSLLVLVAELGGIGLSLQIATSVGYRWWVVPAGLFIWLVLWKGTFGLIENGSSLLGLVTLAFIVAAFKLHPEWSTVAHGLLPTRPEKNAAGYWFIAVSIMGACISPYLMYFYSAGAVEDKWDKTYIGANRIIAGFGMSFGGLLSMAVLVVAAVVFFPRGIQVDNIDQAALVLTTALPDWGFLLLAMALGISCMGAAFEISLAIAYLFAQGFGWNWTENKNPRDESRFALVYTLVIILAMIPLLLGVDPLQVTIISMALTAAALPVSLIPFLLLMNDKTYLGEYTNGWISNTVVIIVLLISFVLSIVAIPLEFLGG